MPIPIDISASRGAGILVDVPSYQSQVEVWLEIMEARKPGFCAENNYTLPKPPDNAAIAWGNAFEDAIIYLAGKTKKDKIINREEFLQNKYLTCHLDGRYEKSNFLHEGKTTSQYYFRDNFGEPGTDRIPIAYQIQVQHQMILAGAVKCILSVLVFPKRQDEFEIKLEKVNYKKWVSVLNEMGYFHQYEIEANKDLQEKMKAHYQFFWENYVLKEIEPPPEKDSDIALLVHAPRGTILADEQVERWASEYKQINSENSELKKRKDQLKILILEYMKKQDQDVEKILDDDSREKWILRDRIGNKLFQYDGKTFR